MRGFPPFHVLLFAAAFMLLAIPLMHLTSSTLFAGPAEEPHDEHHDAEHGSDAAGGPKVVQGGLEHPEGEHVHEAVPALVRLRYAHRPVSVSLKQDGLELLKSVDLNGSPVEVKAAIAVSHEGNELIISAQWPDGTPDTALTVEIEPDGFETRRETRWSDAAALREVVTFQW